MAVSSDDLSVIDQLAEDFVGRLRRGERPTIQSYVDQRPKLAAEIHRLFPTLVAMEAIGSSGRTSPNDPIRSTAPTRIGDYRILRSLGAGGMGIVYEAIQVSLGRHVALKVLPASALKSERFRERFRVEARAAARLQHPHIVPVYGVGEDDGVPYYAMQFIAGRSLDEIARPEGNELSGADETVTLASRGHGKAASTAIMAAESSTSPAPPNVIDVHWVAEIGAQVAGALAYAHGQGVIHRDIKPSNLILDQRGCVWVTDFGLAKTSDADGLTEPGDIVGTIRYMAPERFSGSSDVRSDVYGLGATLYELLTHRPIYDDQDRGQLIHAILNSDPPKPRKRNHAIPRDLETIVLKAIARDAGQRYATADALEVDLKRFLDGRPISARRQTLTGYAWSWCRRKPLAASMAFTVAILLLVMFVGSLVVNVRLDGQNTQIIKQNVQINETQAALKEQLDETNRAHGREAEAKLEARRQLMLALRREAQAARWSRQPGSREEALNAIKQLMALAKEFPLSPEETLEVRNLTIAVSALIDVVSEEGSPSITGNVVFSPDLRFYVLAKEPGLIAYEYPSGREVSRLAVNGLNSQLFSPDNKHLVVGADRIGNGKVGAYLVWDWQSNKVVAQIPAVAGRAYYAINHDGTQIAFARTNGTLATCALIDGQELQSFPIGYQVQGLAYSPDGKRIALHRNKDQLEIWNLAEKKVHLKLSIPSGAGIMSIAWSPNGRLIAAGCSNYRAHVWHAENGQLASDLVGHQAEVTRLFFDPNGEWIATTGWDVTTRFWNPVTGTTLLNLRGTTVAVSDDGRKLAHYSGQSTGILRIDGLNEFHSLHGHLGPKGPWHASFSNDSSILATSSHDAVRFWDSANGRNIGELRPSGGALSTAFHPEGKYLVSAGRTHLSRWPIAYDRSTATIEIGEEEPLLTHQADLINRGERRVAMSSDGSRVAVSNQIRQSIFIFSFEEPNLWRSIYTFPDVNGVQLSPDGKWVFSASWPIPNARIWDAVTGSQVKDLRGSSPVFASFSPDGRRFAYSSSQKGEVVEVGTWKHIANIPPEESGLKSSAIAYSPDSRLLAIVRGNNVIQLLESQSLKEIARLESPDPQGVAQLAFSPDGGRLAAVATTHVVHLWDLRQLRSRLSSLDLDWDHPSIPADVKSDRQLQVRVRGK